MTLLQRRRDMHALSAEAGMPSTSVVESSILITAPLETVWQYTIDVNRWPEWCPTIQAASVQDADQLSIGTEFSVKQPLQPKRRWQVTELVPNKVEAWRTIDEKERFVARHVLVDNRTSIESTLQLRFVPTWWPIQSLLTLAFKAALNRENRALKVVCERSS
ncbi:SRPBCC family protein [Dinoroseobacter sp. S76]|uniref:SRPBCC family protein n=1 Tax=Dinoroseobacter sp. S76 TaxID=3415124 RepID=UPI003C7A4D94